MYGLRCICLSSSRVYQFTVYGVRLPPLSPVRRGACGGPELAVYVPSLFANARSKCRLECTVSRPATTRAGRHNAINTSGSSRGPGRVGADAAWPASPPVETDRDRPLQNAAAPGGGSETWRVEVFRVELWFAGIMFISAVQICSSSVHGGRERNLNNFPK